MFAARRPLRLTSVLALVVVLTGAAAAGVSRARAVTGSAGDFLTCNPFGGDGTGILAGRTVFATGGPHARGGGGGEPALNETHQDLPASAKGKARANFKVTVPVYFHVITDGSVGRVTRDQIHAQIRVLNKTYAGLEGGDATGFSFALSSVDYTDNADWFYANPGGAEHAMKKALHRGGADALNWYSTTAGQYLGWAYLPSSYEERPWIDGVVVDWESMLGTSPTYAGRYDQGETGTHEIGHWLNLEHVFYRGCSNYGDFVDDTPPQKTATNGCPEGQDSCTAPGLDSIHNYMDYSYDTCYTGLTKGQTQRMRDAWLFYRAGA
jgi:hypothetical protein